jgi:transposase, IS5 family
MALGALIIKEKCGYSDIETVEQIEEKPYLQFFIGLKEYKTEAPFDPSLMVHFRKRFNMEAIKAIYENIFLKVNYKHKRLISKR